VKEEASARHADGPGCGSRELIYEDNSAHATIQAAGSGRPHSITAAVEMFHRRHPQIPFNGQTPFNAKSCLEALAVGRHAGKP
jgi:hypothetical protein